MFARWRNLAATAGAFCLPLSFVHASPQSDDFHYTSPPPCTRHYEADESSFFHTERDSWYQRYYGNTLDDLPAIDNAVAADAEPVEISEPNNDLLPPAAVISDIEIIENDADLKSASEECNSIDCPCRDLVTCPIADADPAAEPDATPAEVETQLFDVFEPYSYPYEGSDSYEPALPVAELTGTIEPVDDASDAWIDEWFCGDEPVPSDSNSAADLEPAELIDTPYSQEFGEVTSDGEETGDLDEDSAIDESGYKTDEWIDEVESDKSGDGSKYHMFYPGCDWSPYYPAHRSPAANTLPEDLRSA